MLLTYLDLVLYFVPILSFVFTHNEYYKVGNVASFRIPDPAGRAGGACTSTLLNVVYKDHTDTRSDMSYKDVIDSMRGLLEEKKYAQIPQVRSKYECIILGLLPEISTFNYIQYVILTIYICNSFLSLVC
jgi:hypothetical protein